MKTLQNNFTTPEQSKRLLELGVPADNADMFYYTAVAEYPRIRAHAYGHIPNEHSIPCWSVGQLIKIYITCIEHYTGDERLMFGMDAVRLGMIDCIIAAIEVGCDDGDMDFSKLEE